MSGVLGKYRLDARLGGGGMAEVFIASTVGAEGFSRKVAIKRVLPGFSENPAFARMFVDEARISSRLGHPNIVSVLDFDRDNEGRLYLVMELVPGKDLDALASTGALPIPLIIFVISEVLRGLGHAHDLPAAVDDLMVSGSHTIRQMRGIVHRDVSPHNVLLSWEGAVKVSDFGIAKARSATEATASVFIKGKPAYMSPEQANGEPLDGRSDLFAVGVMIWEMLCGRRLFVGEDTRATLAAVLFGQIPRPRSMRPDVPKDLERIVMKLLERDLPARYATAEDANRDLLQCADAPRDGRELLRQTLAERFPQQAPIRHSLLRQPGMPPTPAPGVPQVSAYGPTVANGPAPVSALPSLGAERATPTGTKHPSSTFGAPKRSKLPYVIIGSAIGAIALVATIASVASNGEKPVAGPPASDAGTGQVAQAPADAAVVTIAPDAASAVAVTPPVDAGTSAPDAGQKDAPPGGTAQAPAKKKFGRLVVTAFPALTVYVDGNKIHDTPVEMPLAVGKHKVRLVNSDLGKDETQSITIKENATFTIKRD